MLPQSSQVSGPDQFVWNEWDWGTQEIARHVRELSAECPVDPLCTVLVQLARGDA